VTAPRRTPPADPARFLPTTRAEMAARGWSELDVLLVTGDAYVDHPSFGAAVIGRVLEAQGFRVGVVAQPDWSAPADVARMGRPRLFAGVTSGAMDSMVNHYTAHKRRRSDDAYTPGGAAGRRPDRAATVYTRLLRAAFGATTPVVLGGVEASLRRLGSSPATSSTPGLTAASAPPRPGRRRRRGGAARAPAPTRGATAPPARRGGPGARRPR